MTLYLWKRQALIDSGRAEGVKSFEADELAQAHKTIALWGGTAGPELSLQPRFRATATSQESRLSH